MAVRELKMKESGFYNDEMFKLLRSLDKCISVLRDYAEK
jgi:hypothetical protein